MTDVDDTRRSKHVNTWLNHIQVVLTPTRRNFLFYSGDATNVYGFDQGRFVGGNERYGSLICVHAFSGWPFAFSRQIHITENVSPPQNLLFSRRPVPYFFYGQHILRLYRFKYRVLIRARVKHAHAIFSRIIYSTSL